MATFVVLASPREPAYLRRAPSPQALPRAAVPAVAPAEFVVVSSPGGPAYLRSALQERLRASAPKIAPEEIVPLFPAGRRGVAPTHAKPGAAAQCLPSTARTIEFLRRPVGPDEDAPAHWGGAPPAAHWLKDASQVPKCDGIIEQFHEEPVQGRRKEKMQNFAECLDELDRHHPALIVACTGFRRCGNKGIGAFTRYLEQNYGPVERPVPVIYVSSDRAAPPQVTNRAFFVMRDCAAAQRVLQTETHTLEDGTSIKVREYTVKL